MMAIDYQENGKVVCIRKSTSYSQWICYTFTRDLQYIM